MKVKILFNFFFDYCDSNFDIELRRLYESINRMPKIKNKLVKSIETYIYKTGVLIYFEHRTGKKKNSLKSNA